MHQNGPSHRKFPVGKAFAAERLAQENILHDVNPAFGLRPPTLQAFELPGAAALLQLPGVARTDAVVDPVGVQPDAIEFTIEAAVSRQGSELRSVNSLHAPHAARQEFGIRRRALAEELPIDDQALGILGQEQGVAEFDLGPGFLADDDPHLRFIQAEDFVFIGHRLLVQNPLPGLLAGLGQLRQHLVHAPQDLLGLRPRPGGLPPLLVEQLPMPAGVAAHDAHQAVHLPQGLLALTPALGRLFATAGMSHLDAELVDAGQKTFRRVHPVLEPLSANERHGFDQGAGGIAQEDPIDRIVDVGFETGGIEKGALQVQGLGQVQSLGGGGALDEELADEGADFGFGPPPIITLERAFAGNGDDIDLADQAEVLQERTVGQTGGEGAVIFFQEQPGEIAAQGPLAVQLVVLLGFGADFFACQPAVEIGLQELSFQAAEAEEAFDAQELIAQVAVIDIALDGGEDLRQGRLEGDNGGVRHGVIL